jgi:tetratricopeptide (TPR) repeat protein
LNNLAVIAQAQGDLDDARRLYNESLEIKKRLGDQSGIALTLHELGRLAEEDGYNAEAAQLFREFLSIFEKLKSPIAEVARRSLERAQSKLK